MKKIIAPLFLVVSASAFAAPAIDGQWKVHNNIAGNESDQVCTLALKDGDVSGTCKTEQGDAAVKGKLEDKKLTWQYQSDYNGTPLTLIYTATLDDSGKIAGTVEVQPFGVTGDFTATSEKQ
jgi:hypothetical protein